MILSSNGFLCNEPQVIRCSFGADTHYIMGFFYVPGHRSGEESAAVVEKELSATGRIPFERMYGSYTYCISRSDQEFFLFAGNGGMSCVYHSQSAASTGYTELLAHLADAQPLQFDLEAVTSYLTLGSTYFGHTFVKEISVLPNCQYIYWKDRQLSVREKGIADLDGAALLSSPYDYFKNLAYAAEKQKVSFSLTGGYDSRAIFTQLCQKLPLKLFISSNIETLKDVVIAKRVAAAAGAPIEVFHTEKPKLDEAMLRKMIYDLGGLTTPVGVYRIYNFKKQLQKQGCTVQFTGDGGVLHKDWEWMQDLPFYHRKKTDLHRFYRQRIAFAADNRHLGPAIQPIASQQESMFVERMKPLVRGINTQSYDMLYYYASSDRRVLYTPGELGYIAYAPLLELDMIRYSYHLPRGKRFYYNYLRELTTHGSPEIARIPTCYGTTASAEPLLLLRDAAVQLKEYGVKFCRLMGRKLFHKTFFSPDLVDWDLTDDLRALPVSQEAVAWAIQLRLLSETAGVTTLSHEKLLRIVHLYILSVDFAITTSPDT